MATGGTNPGGHKGNRYQAGGFTQPPAFTYDPAVEAERRASQRGLEDVTQDTQIQRHRAKVDLHTSLTDLAVQLKRGRRDARLGLRRGIEDIRFKRADIHTKEKRGNEDFGLQLDALVRRFGTQAQVQRQAANAAGVYDAGTLAAGAQARASNFAFARQPIDIGKQRLGEDVATALGRTGVEARRLRKDTSLDVNRLQQDTHHDRRLARQDFHRTRRDAGIKLQRARREQQIGNLDLLQQEIYQARQAHPGAFTKRGRHSGGSN